MIRKNSCWIILLAGMMALSSCSYYQRVKKALTDRTDRHKAIVMDENGGMRSDQIDDINVEQRDSDYWDVDEDWDNTPPEAPDDTEERLKGLEIPAAIGMGELMLVRTGYTTSYNPRTRCPNWTAWVLTDNHTDGPYKRKGVAYHEDEEVPFPKAQNADYARSGYDRGHMCPSGDNRWDGQAQEDCFLFTNMCPQSHNLNAGDWNDLEMKCRKWAERYGRIYIVCGPVYDSGAHSKHRKTIGRSKVVVPDGFFKVVLCMAGTPKAIGFYYVNDDGHAPMSSYVRTVDEIEDMTNMDFFPSLPDDVEARVEAKASLNEW